MNSAIFDFKYNKSSVKIDYSLGIVRNALLTIKQCFRKRTYIYQEPHRLIEQLLKRFEFCHSSQQITTCTYCKGKNEETLICDETIKINNPIAQDEECICYTERVAMVLMLNAVKRRLEILFETYPAIFEEITDDKLQQVFFVKQLFKEIDYLISSFKTSFDDTVTNLKKKNNIKNINNAEQNTNSAEEGANEQVVEKKKYSDHISCMIDGNEIIKRKRTYNIYENENKEESEELKTSEPSKKRIKKTICFDENTGFRDGDFIVIEPQFSLQGSDDYSILNELC